jgi:phytoene desaturase
MLPQAFEEVFELSGKRFSEYVTWKRLDTLYRLHFDDGRDFSLFFDKARLKEEIKRLFPGDEIAYDRYMKDQKKKFECMYPCLKVPYQRWYHYFRFKDPYANNLIQTTHPYILYV